MSTTAIIPGGYCASPLPRSLSLAADTSTNAPGRRVGAEHTDSKEPAKDSKDKSKEPEEKHIETDHTVTIGPEIPPEKWAEFYLTALQNLKPGVTEFVIHPGFDDEELRAATRERSTWGSAWRQRDYDFFTSDQFREILTQQKIRLINWRELARKTSPN